MLTRDRIQQHIDELDSQIPKDHAELLICSDIDSFPDSEIIGNYTGYLRFAIEMLKAAMVEVERGDICTGFSIAYMENARWGLHVKSITRREDVGKHVAALLVERFPPLTWKSYLTGSFEVFLGIFACACLLIGFGEVLRCVWHLLF